MTIRALFTIILKVMGIFFIKEVIVIIPKLLLAVVLFSTSETSGDAIWTFASAFLSLGIYSVVMNYLLFRTTYLIDKLKLDDNFEESELTLSIHRSTILSIAIIIVGALVLVEAIPNFCRDFLLYFQQKRAANSSNGLSVSYMVTDAIKIIIGLLLIGNQKDIVHLVELKEGIVDGLSA